MPQPILTRAVECLRSGSFDGVLVNCDARTLLTMPDDGEVREVPIATVFSSPPYPGKAARYGPNVKPFPNDPKPWAREMFELTKIAVGSVSNWIAWVANDDVKGGVWRPALSRLEVMIADAGMAIDRTNIWHKNAPPNRSDYFGNDYEKIIMVRTGDRYFDPIPLGEPPKFKAGGVFRQRNTKGVRTLGGAYPTNKLTRPRDVVEELATKDWTELLADAREYVKSGIPAMDDGDDKAIAVELVERLNAAMAGSESDVVRVTVGGGHMGHESATNGAAPYPLGLVKRRLPALAAKGDIICDPFNGTMTTGHAAFECDMKYVGSDIDPLMIEESVGRALSIGMRLKVLDVS